MVPCSAALLLFHALLCVIFQIGNPLIIYGTNLVEGNRGVEPVLFDFKSVTKPGHLLFTDSAYIHTVNLTLVA